MVEKRLSPLIRVNKQFNTAELTLWKGSTVFVITHEQLERLRHQACQAQALMRRMAKDKSVPSPHSQ